MVMHTGTSMGYGAMLSMLPDTGIGIYTALTGQDDDYKGMAAVLSGCLMCLSVST